VTRNEYGPDVVRYCIAYVQGKRLGEIDIQDISKTLEQDNTFVWLALHEPDAALLRQIQNQFDLHELAIDDALAAHQRPKLEQYGNQVFIVVKTAKLVDEQLQLGETHMFVGSRFFITVRHGPSTTYQSVRERLETTPTHLGKGPAMAAYGVLDFIVDSYGPVVDAMERRFEQLEVDMFRAKFDRNTIERLYELKRELLVLRGAAAPVLDITDELIRFHSDLVPKELRVYFRDVHDHVIRLTGAVDEIREMLTAAMQVNLALATVEQNDAVRRLAGWGAILAIPTVVFSLYGMNFRHMPELDWEYGYPLAIGAVAFVCVWLYRRLKHYDWL
jgi:magnesium transporter